MNYWLLSSSPASLQWASNRLDSFNRRTYASNESMLWALALMLVIGVVGLFILWKILRNEKR